MRFRHVISRVCVYVWAIFVGDCSHSRAVLVFCAEWKKKKTLESVTPKPNSGPLTPSVAGPACAICVTRSCCPVRYYQWSGANTTALLSTMGFIPPIIEATRFVLASFPVCGCRDEGPCRLFSLQSRKNVVRKPTEVMSTRGWRAKVVAE